MGLQIRDDRQIKALTGLSQAQFDHLLSVFRNIYWATQQKTYGVWHPGPPAGQGTIRGIRLRCQTPTAKNCPFATRGPGWSCAALVDHGCSPWRYRQCGTVQTVVRASIAGGHKGAAAKAAWYRWTQAMSTRCAGSRGQTQEANR